MHRHISDFYGLVIYIPIIFASLSQFPAECYQSPLVKGGSVTGKGLILQEIGMNTELKAFFPVMSSCALANPRQLSYDGHGVVSTHSSRFLYIHHQFITAHLVTHGREDRLHARYTLESLANHITNH